MAAQSISTFIGPITANLRLLTGFLRNTPMGVKRLRTSELLTSSATFIEIGLLLSIGYTV
jgi:hypothetical protein